MQTASPRRWSRYLGGAMTAAILVAVPSLAFGWLSPGALQALSASTEARALPPDGTASDGLLRLEQTAAARDSGNTADAVTVLTTWSFTGGGASANSPGHLKQDAGAQSASSFAPGHGGTPPGQIPH
jgi:hypothetical protein